MTAAHDAAQAARAAIKWVSPYPYSDVLTLCVQQVTSGKGEQRHGHGAPFMRQHWCELARKHSPGFLTGQAEKKWFEANQSAIANDPEQFIREVTGAIVYSLMALIMLADRDVASGKLTPQREAMSAAVWLAGVWPNGNDLDMYERQKRWDSPAFLDHDRQMMIVLTRFQILKMAEAIRVRMASMHPPMVVPAMQFPSVLTERVAR